jgi:hypothetical protein
VRRGDKGLRLVTAASGTDADLLIDALTGPLYFRRIIGHAPVSEDFASELASRALQAFRRPVGL